MTHTSVRWTHVLLGVGATLVVALAPMLFVLASGISVQNNGPQAVGTSRSALLLANGSQLPVHQLMVVLAAAAAVAAILFTIAVSTRAERDR